MAGYFKGVVDFGGGALTSTVYPWLDPLSYQDIFVAKYTATGTHVWSKGFGSVANDVANGVAVDHSGNVVVVGTVQGDVDFGNGQVTSGGGGNDAFVAKYAAATGQVLWARHIAGSGNEVGYGVAVDGNGDVVVTGTFDQQADFGGGVLSSAGLSDIFVAKYAGSDGHYLWARRFGGPNSDAGVALAVDSTGNVTVTGSFQGSVDFGGGPLSSVGGRDIFVAQYAGSDGRHLWSKRFGGTSDDYGYGVAIDGQNHVTVIGSFQGQVDFGGGALSSAGQADIFVVQFTGAGGHRWSKRFGDTSADYGYSVTVDSLGYVTVTGGFIGTVDFGSGPLTSVGYDIFVAQFTGDGVSVWAKRFGGTLSQFGTAVAAASNGQVAITGYFQDTIDFGTGGLTSLGGYDIFLSFLGP
jgi:hypothetical protein